jgi:SulP family sulfate permease
MSKELQRQSTIKQVILIFTSVSNIDMTALEALENLNRALQEAHITLYLTEVKGPVLDKLNRTNFVDQLKPGKVFFCTEDAIAELA